VYHGYEKEGITIRAVLAAEAFSNRTVAAADFSSCSMVVILTSMGFKGNLGKPDFHTHKPQNLWVHQLKPYQD
jgi:hypothetical protein